MTPETSFHISSDTLIVGLLALFLAAIGLLSRREWKWVLLGAAFILLLVAYGTAEGFFSMKDKNKILVVFFAAGFTLSLLYRGVRTPEPERPKAPPEQVVEPGEEKPSPAEPAEKAEQEKEQPKAEVKPRSEGGLRFREVPPEKLGVKVPETFTVDFGTNTSTFARERLAEQVPFESLSGMKFPGDIPLRIWFDENGELRVDATVYDEGGRLGALIKANDFTVLNAAWDRNWDGNAFEIVNEKEIPFFQIERPRENLIRIRGVFITSEGSVLVSTNQGLFGNPTRPVPPPEPLFAYPSDKNPHKRLR